MKSKAKAGGVPKGSLVEKVDVWLPPEMKRRLEAIAAQEGRSTTKQASYFIEIGINGVDLTALAHAVVDMEAKLNALLKHIEEEKPSGEG